MFNKEKRSALTVRMGAVTNLFCSVASDNIRMTFSDGLASFSLFVDRVGQGRSSSSRVSRQWGPVSATVEDILTQDGQRVRLSVVGELPPMTLDKVLDSAIPSYSLSMK